MHLKLTPEELQALILGLSEGVQSTILLPDTVKDIRALLHRLSDLKRDHAAEELP